MSGCRSKARRLNRGSILGGLGKEACTEFRWASWLQKGNQMGQSSHSSWGAPVHGTTFLVLSRASGERRRDKRPLRRVLSYNPNSTFIAKTRNSKAGSQVLHSASSLGKESNNTGATHAPMECTPTEYQALAKLHSSISRTPGMQGKSGGRIQDPEGNCQILQWPKKQGQVPGPLGTLLSGALLVLPKS